MQLFFRGLLQAARLRNRHEVPKMSQLQERVTSACRAYRLCAESSSAPIAGKLCSMGNSRIGKVKDASFTDK